MDNDTSNTQVRSKAQRTGFMGWSITGFAAVAAVGFTTFAFLSASQPSPPVNQPPQLLDFVAPYACPENDAPASCSEPIKVSVECVDMRTIDPRQLLRPLTETEISNAEKACELLPNWIDQDPRIDIVEGKNENNHWVYKLSPSGKDFIGVRIFIDEISFSVKKTFQIQNDKASYFIEKSLIEIERRGYLP
jgi:hypothetical protein